MGRGLGLGLGGFFGSPITLVFLVILLFGLIGGVVDG